MCQNKVVNFECEFEFIIIPVAVIITYEYKKCTDRLNPHSLQLMTVSGSVNKIKHAFVSGLMITLTETEPGTPHHCQEGGIGIHAVPATKTITVISTF